MTYFLSARAVFINLNTILRKSRNKSDTKNVNIRAFAQSLWNCKFLPCPKYFRDMLDTKSGKLTGDGDNSTSHVVNNKS